MAFVRTHDAMGTPSVMTKWITEETKYAKIQWSKSHSVAFGRLAYFVGHRIALFIIPCTLHCLTECDRYVTLRALRLVAQHYNSNRPMSSRQIGSCSTRRIGVVAKDARNLRVLFQVVTGWCCVAASVGRPLEIGLFVATMCSVTERLMYTRRTRDISRH